MNDFDDQSHLPERPPLLPAILKMAAAGLLAGVISVFVYNENFGKGGVLGSLPGAVYGVIIAIPLTWNQRNQFWKTALSGFFGLLAFDVAKYTWFHGGFSEVYASLVGALVYGIPASFIFRINGGIIVLYVIAACLLGLVVDSAKYVTMFPIWQTGTAAVLGFGLAIRNHEDA
jgi:hypothetical protein